MVFAAYWSGVAKEKFAMEVFQRWFPMHLKTSRYDVPMDAASLAFEVSSKETARDVFDRVVAALGEDAFPRGWDSQVG